jgi:CheY-like chemotaxis protein
MVILVLDDNPEITSLLSMMVNRLIDRDDCKVITGRTGQEGLEWLSMTEHLPDVIISNFRMPQMDGMTFLRQVRRNTDWSQIHLVLMSALQTPELRSEASASGAEAFLAKPFTLNDLKNVLDDLLPN